MEKTRRVGSTQHKRIHIEKNFARRYGGLLWHMNETAPSAHIPSARPIVRRPYKRDVQEKLFNLDQGCLIQNLGQLDYGNDHAYASYVVRCPATPKKERPTVLISGGVHGDEPAGVYAALDFLKNTASQYAHLCNFVVFPCVNPSGFEADTIKTMHGANLNRLFNQESPQPEIRMIEQWLSRENRRYHMTFDLHEVSPQYAGNDFKPEDLCLDEEHPQTCWLWETVVDTRKRIGRMLIDALPAGTEVCRWPKIYGDRNDNGVIAYPEACENPIYAQPISFDSYLSTHHTDHSFTCETPTIWPMEKRVATHLTWLRTALKTMFTHERTP